MDRARRGIWVVDSKNRRPRAGRLPAVPAVFGPEDLHGAGDVKVADPMDEPFLPSRCDDTSWAARWLVGLDNDVAPVVVQDGSGDIAVVGQVEKPVAAPGGDPSSLSQDSRSCS